MSRAARARDNGWVKIFANGGRIHGLDRDISSGKCSWKKTQLHSLVTCRVHHDGVTLEITGPGDYWQSDSLTAVMRLGQTVKPEWCERRLQRKIEPTDKFLIVRKPTRHHLCLEISASNPTQNLNNIQDILVFKPEEVGQWLTAEVEVDGFTTRWYMSQEKI